MKVAIYQPNYLPWCGYFTKLKACDLFVFLDDAQMSNGRTFVSRTKLRSETLGRWLTIPTRVHDNPRIADVVFADNVWPQKHLATFRHVYGKSQYFDDVWSFLEPIYATADTNFSEFNQRLIRAIAAYLDIERPMLSSSSFELKTKSGDRLIDLVRHVKGSHYISGVGGSNYQDPLKFLEAEVNLEVREYVPVPYDAPNFPFIAGLSILDALFVVGTGTRDLLRYDDQRHRDVQSGNE